MSPEGVIIFTDHSVAPKVQTMGMRNEVKYLVCIFFLLTTPLLADPWGKDADLAHYAKKRQCQVEPPQQVSNPLVKWAEEMISFHQTTISPADGPRSHFIPSSSQYTLEAIKKYGFFKGYIMGCDRLMRENDDPWVYRKTVDPVGRPMKSDPVK